MLKLQILRGSSTEVVCVLDVVLSNGEFTAHVDEKMASAIKSAIPERKPSSEDIAREFGFNVEPSPQARERMAIARDVMKKELAL